MESNKVKISGIIETELKFNNKQHGESFYNMIISVERNSGVKDYISLLISERLINIRENYIGQHIIVTGQFRSYNLHSENKSKLILYVFVRELEFIQNTKTNEAINHIELEGYICKNPIFRTTPLGREIADILLAVNRPYGKSDYIPCICWGRNARYVDNFKVGDNVCIQGRIQSREYAKKISEQETEIKTAYEVSIISYELIFDEQNRDAM